MSKYNYQGRIYSVVKCEKEDIPSHIERVSSYWVIVNVNVDEQIKILEESVKNGTAWKLIDDTGTTKSVIYCRKINEHDAQSNLLWLEDKRMFAILCYFLRMTAYLYKIYFKPHTKDFIPFEFIVQDNSIRSFHTHDTPLKIDLYSVKSQKLYENHFLKRGIVEVV